MNASRARNIEDMLIRRERKFIAAGRYDRAADCRRRAARVCALRKGIA